MLVGLLTCPSINVLIAQMISRNMEYILFTTRFYIVFFGRAIKTKPRRVPVTAAPRKSWNRTCYYRSFRTPLASEELARKKWHLCRVTYLQGIMSVDNAHLAYRSFWRALYQQLVSCAERPRRSQIMLSFPTESKDFRTSLVSTGYPVFFISLYFKSTLK